MQELPVHGIEGLASQNTLSSLPTVCLTYREDLGKAGKHLLCGEPNLDLIVEPLKLLAQQVRGRVPSMGETFDDVLELFEGVLVPNAAARQCMRLIFKGLESIVDMTVPSSIEQALDGFKLAASRRCHERSYLSITLQLAESLTALEKHACRIHYIGQDVRVHMVPEAFEESAEKGRLSSVGILAALSRIPQLPPVEAVAGSIGDCLQRCIVELVSMTRVRTLEIPPLRASEDTDPKVSLKHIVDVEGFEHGGALDEVLQTFGVAEKTPELEATSPCTSLRCLTAKLMDRLGDDFVAGGTVDCSSVCQAGQPASKDTLKYVLKKICQVSELATILVYVRKIYMENRELAITKTAFLKEEVEHFLSEVDRRHDSLQVGLAETTAGAMLEPSIWSKADLVACGCEAHQQRLQG